ncbi:MAG: ATP-binding protein, partial [Polyangiaceae bacterium]
SFLEADAGKANEPLVLMFDDLQFAHDDSLELLSMLVESVRGRILLVCLARPEMLVRREGWRSGTDRHVEIELSPLADQDAALIMRDLLASCADAPGIDQLVDSAVALAGGNPALLDQMVRVYRENGVVEVTDDFEDERFIIHPERLAGVKLPLTVKDAVIARIAALAPHERALLERAAAMGGVFWLSGLVAIQRMSLSPPDLWGDGEESDVAGIRSLLSELVERDYVLRLPDSTFAGDEEYVFKHNLEREALVGLTPPANGRRHHQGIAECLSFRRSADASEEYLEMLARHRERAGAMALAAWSYVEAAREARSRSANAKAAELLGKGLAALEGCDPADEDLRLKALHAYGDVLQALGRGDDALRAFGGMRTRAWRLGLRTMGGVAHWKIGRLVRDAGRLDEASRQLTAALSLFGQEHDDAHTASALEDIGKLHWMRADFALAIEYISRALALRRRGGEEAGIASSLNSLGLVQGDAGRPAAAFDSLALALHLRQKLGDLVGVSITLNGLGSVAADLGEEDKALAFFEAACAAAKDTGDRNRIALILTNLAETHRRRGDSEKGAALLQQAEDAIDEFADRLGLAEATCAIAKARLARGEHEKARHHATRAVNLFTVAGDKAQLGVALRMLSLSEVSSAANGGDGLGATADHLKRSIAIFEDLGNELELARTCQTYAQILQRTADHDANEFVAAEARRLGLRAEAIFTKVRALAATGTGSGAFGAPRVASSPGFGREHGTGSGG